MGTIVQCDNNLCKNIFHRGCHKKYLKVSKSLICCKIVHNFIVSKVDFSSIMSSGQNSISVPFTLDKSQVNSGRHRTLEDLQPRNSDMDNLDESLMLTGIKDIPEPDVPDGWEEMSTDQKLTAIIIKSKKTVSLIEGYCGKLNDVIATSNKHTQSLVNHDKRILDIDEKMNVAMTSFMSLKNSIIHSNNTAEIIIDGLNRGLLGGGVIDCEVNDTSPMVSLVRRILSHIGANNVIIDVLNITEFKKKNDSPNNLSIKVLFKSSFVRDFVLEKKRQKGILRIKDFSNSATDDIVYINELLPKHIYNLFLKAKMKKRNINWDGYIWKRGGRIFAKSNVSNTTHVLFCDEDLQFIS